MAASKSAFDDAVDAFNASPSIATKRAMCSEFAKLPKGGSGDGGSFAFDSLASLEAWADRELASAASARDQRRVILGRTSYGGIR